MPERTLQDRVQSFRINLELLATGTGKMDFGNNAAARSFYEFWAALNQECIAAGFEDDEANFSYVTNQLDNLLSNFRANRTEVDIRDVFPMGFGPFLFTYYVEALNRVSAHRSIPA